MKWRIGGVLCILRVNVVIIIYLLALSPPSHTHNNNNCLSSTKRTTQSTDRPTSIWICDMDLWWTGWEVLWLWWRSIASVVRKGKNVRKGKKKITCLMHNECHFAGISPQTWGILGILSHNAIIITLLPYSSHDYKISHIIAFHTDEKGWETFLFFFVDLYLKANCHYPN